MANQTFATLLEAANLGLARATIQKIDRFRELVVEENARQNLTRLLEPKDFLEGHVEDAVHLLKCGFLQYPAADLGSGVGVPGLLCAIMDPKPWVLIESEGHKAAFLARAVDDLGLKNVVVSPKRAEDYLKKGSVETITARAVGKITKIYGWIAGCSTWNSLVLLKGPGWEEEWAEFQKSGQRAQLKISGEYRYQSGSENKQRVIVKLDRVPRGTSV
jgi:16S rRNA (guanine527-N7)-methyltransferase